MLASPGSLAEPPSLLAMCLGLILLFSPPYSYLSCRHFPLCLPPTLTLLRNPSSSIMHALIAIHLASLSLLPILLLPCSFSVFFAAAIWQCRLRLGRLVATGPRCMTKLKLLTLGVGSIWVCGWEGAQTVSAGCAINCADWIMDYHGRMEPFWLHIAYHGTLDCGRGKITWQDRVLGAMRLVVRT